MRSLRSSLRLLQGLQQAALADAAGQHARSAVPASAAGLTNLYQAQARTLATSTATPAAAAAAAADSSSVLKEIDRIISSEAVGAKEVSDAAVALAYLQASNRRLWGKVFEKVPAVQSSFDATTLSSFLWATTTAGVGHFKTIAELSGAAQRLLPSLSPTQLSLVVEGLGRAGAKDEALLALVADKVSANVAAFKGADLARIVWGFGAAGADDAKLIKAVAKALGDKAGELTGREASQAVWGLARLRVADKPVLDSLVKAAKTKLDSSVDAAGLAWSLGFIGYQADADTIKSIGSVLKAGASQLTPAHAVDAVWGLGVLGGDKDAATALFTTISSAVEAAPDALDPYQLAALYEAAAMNPAAKLPDTVSAYAGKMHALVEEGAKGKRSAGLAAFKEDLAQAVARAMGARYRPEIAAQVKSFASITPDGVSVDIAVPLDAQTKLAIEAVGPHYLSSAGTPLGPALARAALLESKGFKVVLVPFTQFAELTNITDKAKLVLNRAKTSVPAIASKVSALQAKLNEPFDPYA